jgi:hypothetical protein
VADNVLAKMPNIIRYQYRLEEWDICGVTVTAMMPLAEVPSPKELCRHADIVHDATARPSVLIFDALPAYVRLRLARKRQLFVVAGRQVFMPDMMLVTQTRKAVARVAPKLLSAQAQLLVLSHVLHREPDHVTGQELARRFGGTTMTWSRALSELVALEVGEETRVHKSRHFRFVLPRRPLWEKLQGHLRTPVLKKMHVKGLPSALPSVWAGYSALSMLTDIAEPDVAECAVAANAFRAHRTAIEQIPWPEQDSVLLQVWRYDPGILAQKGTVDRLSLYLSLREDQDERTEKARDQLLEGVQW